MTAHHRFLLQLHLGQIDALDQAIARIDEEVKTGLDSFREATLSDAETFFADNLLDFGDIAGGVKNVAFTDDLTSKTPGDGFGFDLAIGEVSVAVPEPLTWSMGLFGFGLLGLALYRNGVAGRPRGIKASNGRLAFPSGLNSRRRRAVGGCATPVRRSITHN